VVKKIYCDYCNKEISESYRVEIEGHKEFEFCGDCFKEILILVKGGQK